MSDRPKYSEVKCARHGCDARSLWARPYCPDHSQDTEDKEDTMQEDTMQVRERWAQQVNIENQLRTFVLNIPEVLSLRKSVASLESQPEATPGMDEDTVCAIVEREVEYAFSNAVEDALRNGYVDITSNVDVSSLDLSYNGAFETLEERVDALESIDSERIEILEQRLEAIERRLREASVSLDI